MFRERVPRSFSSVFGWREQRGHGPIRFRDDPQLFCLGDSVAAHQPEPVLEAQFVLRLVILAQITSITSKMPVQEFQR